MKHLVLCNRILAGEDIDFNSLAEFVADYCIIKDRLEALQYIPYIIQMLNSRTFDIIYMIEEYAKHIGKQFYTLTLLKDRTILKQWIQ